MECRKTKTIVTPVANQNKEKKRGKTWVTVTIDFTFTTFDWLRGKSEKNDTRLKITVADYSRSVFRKKDFCRGRVAPGYILKAEGLVEGKGVKQ